MDNRPIGVFDSGLGGLTAVKELKKILPGEDIVYFGDTGRVPYGTRSDEIIEKYTRQDIAFFDRFSVKTVICACGTASSVGLPKIKSTPVPVTGVIYPTALDAVKATKNGKIGIIGTEGTISSGAYEKEIKKLMPDAQTLSVACTLFVPLAESGYIDKKATYLIAEDYLKPLKEEEVDTLILGCTHYPLLKKVIGDIMGSGVTLTDAGKSAADYVKGLLSKADMLSDRKEGKMEFYTSDSGRNFAKSARLFLGEEIDSPVKIDIEKVKE